MQRFHNLMLMSVTAILISYCHTTYAGETIIHKCTRDDGKIVFQDQMCPDEQSSETIVFQTPKQKPLGLRALELLNLQRIYQRQMRELGKKNTYPLSFKFSGCCSACSQQLCI